MSSVFTRIINGELPGRFVWQDDAVVAFLSIGPLTDGHTLVVPREEVDEWIGVDPALMRHLTDVAQIIGAAQKTAFGSERVGLMIAGFEVPHLHVHVWPTHSLNDFNLANAQHNPNAQVMDRNAEAIRQALRNAGHGDNVPAA